MSPRWQEATWGDMVLRISPEVAIRISRGRQMGGLYEYVVRFHSFSQTHVCGSDDEAKAWAEAQQRDILQRALQAMSAA